MKTPPSLNLPITACALARFTTQAQSEGISLEAVLSRLAQEGFGVSLAALIANTLEDAAAERASRQRRKAA